MNEEQLQQGVQQPAQQSVEPQPAQQQMPQGYQQPAQHSVEPQPAQQQMPQGYQQPAQQSVGPQPVQQQMPQGYQQPMQEEVKKSNTRRWILVLMLVILIGIGATYYIFQQNNKNDYNDIHLTNEELEYGHTKWPEDEDIDKVQEDNSETLTAGSNEHSAVYVFGGVERTDYGDVIYHFINKDDRVDEVVLTTGEYSWLPNAEQLDMIINFSFVFDNNGDVVDYRILDRETGEFLGSDFNSIDWISVIGTSRMELLSEDLEFYEFNVDDFKYIYNDTNDTIILTKVVKGFTDDITFNPGDVIYDSGIYRFAKSE